MALGGDGRDGSLGLSEGGMIFPTMSVRSAVSFLYDGRDLYDLRVLFEWCRFAQILGTFECASHVTGVDGRS